MASSGQDDKVKIGQVPLAEKKPAGVSGIPVKVSTNIRKITIGQAQAIYKYDVNIVMHYDNREKPVFKEISRSKKINESQHRFDMTLCMKIYKRTVSDNQGVFGGNFFYDRQALLYSTKRLKEANYQFEYGRDEFGEEECKTTIKIKAVTDKFQVATSDIESTVNAAPALADRTLLEALNAIISGPIFDNPNVVTFNNSVHYLLDAAAAGIPEYDTLWFDTLLKGSRFGVSNSVKTLEGEQGKKGVYLTTEVKHTLFHEGDALYDKIRGVPGFHNSLPWNSDVARRLLQEIKGLECWVAPKGKKIKGRPMVTIKGFGPPASEQKFEKDGKLISVQRHFELAYGVKFNYPKLFTICTKGKGGDNYYPVEVLKLCSDQIVKTEQLARVEQAEAIKKSAVVPMKRCQQTSAVTRAVGVLYGRSLNEIMSVSEQAEVVPARILSEPVLNYNKMVAGAGAKKQTGNQSSSKTFVECAKIARWELHVIEMNRAPNLLDYKEYTKHLLEKAKASGMNLPMPTFRVMETYDSKRFEQDFQDAKLKRGCQFLMVISRDQLNLHSTLKSLEQHYDLLTQDIRGSVAKKTIEKRPVLTQTLENVVNKINLKNGGLNYNIGAKEAGKSYAADARFVFIGFGTTQRATSAASDVPVMVGYSSNCTNNSQKFAGGFKFVPKGPDVFGPVIKDVVKDTIEKIKKNRSVAPARVVIFFNGVSEGQFSMINETYVKLVKEAYKEFGEKHGVEFKPSTTILAVSKTHQERFYVMPIPNGKAIEQNIKPGLVVDSKVVNPVFNEFYLNAHVAFQGTAKTPKYTLIYDDAKITMDILETLTHQLCYLHEIILKPVSLPAPLIIADRYAKRASLLFSEACRSGANYLISREGEEDSLDFVRLNRELGYGGKALDAVRYNA